MEEIVNPSSLPSNAYVDVAEFISKDLSRRHRVRQVPFRTIPLLIVFNADGSPTAPSTEALGVDPLLDEVIGFVRSSGDYSWTTPKYRELSERLGFDPDDKRPKFEPHCQEVGDALIDLVQQAMGWRPYDHVDLIFDVINLLRIDERPTAHALWKAERAMTKDVSATDRARPLLVKALALVDRQNLARPKGHEAVTHIRFLPSAEGRGYLASISGGGVASDAEGWQADMHDGLTGVALIPDSDAPWAKTAMAKLSSLHGVKFLNDAEGADYMKGEWAEWAEFHARQTTPAVAAFSSQTKLRRAHGVVRRAVDSLMRRIG